MPSTKIRKKILTVLFYGLLGGASSLVLFLIFYWSLRLNASIYNLVTFYRDLPLYFWPYVILTIATLILFGIHVPLLVYRWRKYGLPKIGGPAGAGVGSVIGILASACPICGSALLSIIGIAGGLAAFPFGGLELKAVSFGFMAVPLVLTGRELQRFAKGGDACPVPHDSSLKAKERPWLVILLVAVVVLGYVAVTMLAGDPIFLVFRNKRVLSIPQTDSVMKLARNGVIDRNKFEEMYKERGGLPEELHNVLTQASYQPILLKSSQEYKLGKRRS